MNPVFVKSKIVESRRNIPLPNRSLREHFVKMNVSQRDALIRFVGELLRSEGEWIERSNTEKRGKYAQRDVPGLAMDHRTQADAKVTKKTG